MQDFQTSVSVPLVTATAKATARNLFHNPRTVSFDILICFVVLRKDSRSSGQSVFKEETDKHLSSIFL